MTREEMEKFAATLEVYATTSTQCARSERLAMLAGANALRRWAKEPPDCTCDGGEQGDGLCALPHDESCPMWAWERREV
jgi:hypothetical protein